MNKYQKRVQKEVLKNEREILKELEDIYQQALNDIMAQIAYLQARTDTQNLQSIIYQLEYQQALKTQISAILDQLHNNEFKSISDYLVKCYEESWIGTLYDLQNQGIPLIFPINQKQVVEALLIDTKLSETLYKRIGIDIQELKSKIKSVVSRGISQSYSYEKISKLIYDEFNNPKLNAIRIARTEGHRISQEATYNVQVDAKKNGADIVKEWDATLDSKTRPSHQFLDGQIVDIDKPFKNADGDEAMYPGGFGIASEDINCRCCVLQRAKWNLNNKFTKMNGETNKLMEFKNKEDYNKFKAEFWKWSENQ